MEREFMNNNVDVLKQLEVKNRDNTQKRALNITVENISNNLKNRLKNDTNKSQTYILKIDNQSKTPCMLNPIYRIPRCFFRVDFQQ